MTRLLPEMIASRAEASPDAIAVAQWDNSLSYRDLVDRAARLATRLRAAGTGPEIRVAICARRTPSLVAAILGVLLAGGAYVPLDLAYPARRLLGILNDSGAVAAVADEAGSALLADAPVPVLPADDDAPGPADDRETDLRPADALPGNAAYVMYTSGSTGRPKGVVVSHASLAAFAEAVGRRFALGPGCRAIGFASAAFDVSVLDILVPLSAGASVQLVPDRDRIDPARLQRFLEAHQVTWGVLPPAVLPLLDPERLPSLADVLTAGEPPGPAQVARWTGRHGRRFHNWYGPTETTVCVTGAELSGSWERPLPIGKPLPGNAAYVLNDRFEPCPPGVPGELCIGGPQLARGYLGRPAETAERFVPDPFGGVRCARLYRTGDRAVWQEDGNIAFLGRLDRQVKISGQRVEVGEIEAVLCGHPRVSHAVVGLEPTGAGTPRLVAYLTPVTAPGAAEIREYCAQRLPPYMVPSRVVNAASLPLNVAGKVDLGTLRASGPVAGLWTDLLGAGQDARGTAPDEDFFASGGDSLLAMRLVAAIRAQTGRAVTVEDVFAGRTLAGIGARVATAPAIEPIDATVATGPASAAMLSPGQRRLWFVERLAPGTPVHNIACAQRLTGRLNVPALRAALQAVAQRHEVLRWRIADLDGVPEVRAGPAADLPSLTDDLTGLDQGSRPAALLRLLDDEASAAFDLTASPPWRVRLIRLGPYEHVLAITVHHLVFDGWSQGVLYRDLSAAYRAAAEDGVDDDSPLAAPQRTFGDYVAALAVRGDRDVTWWAAHLDGAPQVIDLPRDRARPRVRTFRGATADIAIGGGPASAIRRLAARLGATPFAVLLAAFGYLLRRLTGQPDLIVGTPFADRADAAFDEVIGFLLNIAPLRLRVSDDASFEEHVRRCAEEISAAFAHPDAPLDRLVALLGVPRELSRNPLIQVLFNMYNFGEHRLDLPGVAAEPLRPGLPGSLFDLTLYVSDNGDGMELRAVYNPDLFAAERIHALLASYSALLATLTARPGLPVRQARLRLAGGHQDLPDSNTPLPGWEGPGVVDRAFGIARARPDAVAVTGPAGRLSYRSATALAAATTAAVRAAGAAEGDAVAVLATRDIRLPAILLGVLASGARWVVLDPDAPPKLLARQVAALGVRAVVSFAGSLDGQPVIDVGTLAAAGAAPLVTGTQDTRGYLALTSGTTGEPAPVLAAERPLAHFLAWYPARFGLGQDDRFALLSGLGHDPALRDMFTPMVTGALLCVPEQAWLPDPVRLATWLRDEQVTVLHLTPPLARLLAAARRPLPAVRLIALGGDQATFGDVAAIRAIAPAARVVSFYGTTETPQAHGCYEVAAGGDDDVLPVPAGWGIEGSQLLVLDPGGKPAGVGELGEVAIRSTHLAAGYADPELTRRRFTGGADRMFRTGDLGRYRPDGAVVLAGRADDQVKIRGFRVELGEVRAAILGHQDIKDGFVLPRTRNGERSLHAFAVPAYPSVRETDVLAHLRASLPRYAVPAHLTLLAELPLTANGKVDREALARMSPDHWVPPAQDPASRTERTVAAVWRDVLGLPRIGVTDNFFEIGGHSLAMAEIQARLERQFHTPVTIVDLFRYPSIRALAAHLDGQATDSALDRAARRTAMRRERARRWKESSK